MYEDILKRWDKIIDRIYYEKEHFEYKNAKRLYKDINRIHNDTIKTIDKIKITLALTNFEEQVELEKQLKKDLDNLIEFEKYLTNFTDLQPKDKKGYYNYLTSCVGYL